MSIERYADRYGVSDLDAFDRFLKVIMALDREDRSIRAQRAQQTETENARLQAEAAKRLPRALDD